MNGAVLGMIRTRLPRSVSRRLPRQIRLVKIPVWTAHNLDQRFFQRGRPANVLSFRYNPAYGEILVCPAVIRQDARRQGNPYQYQMTWMIVHAMLHLAGMHHERSRRMAVLVTRLETMMLRKLFKPRS